MTRTLVIMLKEPRPGRVKTRLGKDIGMATAAWWFRHQSKQLIRNVQDRRWRVVLAVSPDREGLQSKVWPRHLARIPQGNGTLGDRMQRALGSQRPGPVCIIGADIPNIRRRYIANAFHALGQSDVVFGPAPDGGFWLVGLKYPRRRPAGMFANVRWSTRYALADTMATMPGLNVSFADILQDVDTADDLLMTSKSARAT